MTVRGGINASISRHIAFILIAAIVTFVNVSYYLYVLSNPVQRNAPERTGPAVTGIPVDFELALQTPFSPYQHDVRDLNHFLLALNLFICGLVGVLAVYIDWRYRRSRNPYPAGRRKILRSKSFGQLSRRCFSSLSPFHRSGCFTSLILSPKQN
jgi:hypothetical protein